MEPKVIEGTWEEVAQRGQELAGHRVRVTVLDDVSGETPTDEQASPPANDPILGFFRDAPQLLDDVVDIESKSWESCIFSIRAPRSGG